PNQTSYQPSTPTQVSGGQSVSISPVQGSYGAEIQRQSLNLPSSVPVWAGQSTSTSQAQSMGASTLYQGLTSGKYLLPLTQSISSSSLSMASTNQISGFQWPSTRTAVSAGQTASTSQAESIDGSLDQGLTSGRYLTSLAQSIPSSSQSVVSTNRISEFQNQMTYQPSITTQVSDANSVSISKGSYGAKTSGHANWYTSLPGQTIASSSQVSEIQKPSLNPLIAKQLWAGQSVSISQTPFQHTLPK
ncbi:cell wall protein RBR3-like, partial [Tachysurus ichikawai]